MERRRGQGYAGAKEFADARKDFSKILEIEPNNAAAKSELAKVNAAEQAFKKKQQQAFAGLFSS